MCVPTLSRLQKLSVKSVPESRRQRLQMRADSQPQSGWLPARLVDHRILHRCERFKCSLEFDARAGFLKLLLDLCSFIFRCAFLDR